MRSKDRSFNQEQTVWKRVQINDWKFPRRVIITRKEIILEVASQGCHCSRCKKRVEEFKQILLQKPEVEYSWIWDGGYWLVLSKPKKNTLQYLRKVLNLHSLFFL